MVPPPIQECSALDCSYVTPTGIPTWELVTTHMTNHTNSCHQTVTPASAQSSSKLERLPRPTFSLGMSEAAWEFKTVQWTGYIEQITATVSQKLQQLQAACTPDLLQRVYDTGSYSTLTSAKLFMVAMEKIAVLKVHKAVHTMNMWKMCQQSDENIRAFAARITGTADLCGMTLKCTNCQTGNSYRDQVVLHIMLHGMRDNVIRSKVMSRNTTGDLTGLHTTVDFIEAEEAGSQEALDIHEHSQVNAIHRSTYKQSKADDAKQKNCNYCGGSKHGDTNNSNDRQKHCKAWGKTCSKCKKENHLASVCRSKPKTTIVTDNTADVASIDAIAVGDLYSITAPTVPDSGVSLPSSTQDLLSILAQLVRTSSSPNTVSTIPLPHHVHSHVEGWLQTKPSNSPSLSMEVTLDRQSYAQLSVPIPSLYHNRHRPGRLNHAKAITDTGAQITVGPTQLLHHLGVKSETIFTVATNVNAATSTPLTVQGAVLLKLTARNNATGVTLSTRQLVYISSSVDQL